MSKDPVTAMPDMEVTFSPREAAALLGRSYSWLDQALRASKFTKTDGSVIQPLRTPGGYRRFSQQMLQDISLSCYRRGRFSRDALAHALCRMVAATGGLVPFE
jgi:hypothetical protein